MHASFELRQDDLLVSQDNGGYTKYRNCVKIKFGGNAR